MPLFLIGSSSFLQVTTIKAWMTLNFCQIQQLTIELAALGCLKNQCLHFLAHLSQRLVGELMYTHGWASVRLGISPSSSTISNMNISATSGPKTMKFYQKHHWDGGKAALGFWPDRIKTLVSMATDSSHRVIMEKKVLPLFLSCFSSDPFYTCR